MQDQLSIYRKLKWEDMEFSGKIKKNNRGFDYTSISIEWLRIDEKLKQI